MQECNLNKFYGFIDSLTANGEFLCPATQIKIFYYSSQHSQIMPCQLI